MTAKLNYFFFQELLVVEKKMRAGFESLESLNLELNLLTTVSLFNFQSSQSGASHANTRKYGEE
jgi:hypothetical protein